MILRRESHLWAMVTLIAFGTSSPSGLAQVTGLHAASETDALEARSEFDPTSTFASSDSLDEPPERDQDRDHAGEGEQGEQKEEPDRPFRLLRLEEAYTQEKGEWQFRLTMEYSRRSAAEREREGLGGLEITRKTVKEATATFDVEYGLTNRLELDLSVPVTLWQHHHGVRREFEFGMLESSSRIGFDEEGFGTSVIGLSYALLLETDRSPAVTVQIGAILPTGDADDGLGSNHGGFELGVGATRAWDRLFATANFEFGLTVEESREYEYGLGLLYLLGPGSEWGVSVELQGSAEEELDGGAWEHSLHLVPGISYGWTAGDRYCWQVGLGVPVGLTGVAKESDDFGVILQWQVEF